MTSITDNTDEVEALRKQLAAQARLIESQSAQISDQSVQLENKQLLLDESREHIAWLEETLALLRSKRYSHNSEKLNALQGQLFDESEMDAAIKEITKKAEKERQEREAKKRGEKQERAASRKPEDRPRRKTVARALATCGYRRRRQR